MSVGDLTGTFCVGAPCRCAACKTIGERELRGDSCKVKPAGETVEETAGQTCMNRTEDTRREPRVATAGQV